MRTMSFDWRALPIERCRLIGARCQVKRCFAAYRRYKMVPHHFEKRQHSAHERGHLKWSQARLGGRLFGRTMLYKQFIYFDSILYAGNSDGVKPLRARALTSAL